MIAALLSFFDERPDDLVRCIASLPRAGVEHVVVVDGPYAAFPHEHVSSPINQYGAVRAAAWSAGLGLTVHCPREAWAGNEIEKRTFMHRLALAVTGPDAWHLVIDADEVVDSAEGLPERLAADHRTVGEVMCRESGGGGGLRRRLFRAQPMHLERRHCIYVADDGAVLADPERDSEQVPALLSGLVMSHRPEERREDRIARKDVYYHRLPEGGHATCEWAACGRPATQRVRTNFRVMSGELLSDPMDVCQFCADVARGQSADQLRGLGFDARRVAV